MKSQLNKIKKSFNVKNMYCVLDKYDIKIKQNDQFK